MQFPSLSQAEKLLQEAESSNPGPWVAHSRNAALAAQRIAARVPGMDPEAARILALLHDIGRYPGPTDMLHILHGYHRMMDEGYPAVARICLTHSFPLQDIRTMAYNWDGTAEQAEWIGQFLSATVYDDYDHLVQLCDALALPTGLCLIEKRMVDVALRRGFNEFTLPKWRATFAIQRSFEERIGQPVYALLPGVVESTFQALPA